MHWLEDRIRSAARFSLGAILPFLGLVFLGLLGALLLRVRDPGLGVLAWPAGLFLLGNALYGLGLGVKSFPRPPGRILAPGEAPALEERLEAAREAWEGPRGAQVILAPDAWSVELTGVPMAGLFGWSRYHWYVGIYPLLALSPRELDAAIEWEEVFWSDYQGWLNLQVKRLATYWYRVHVHVEARLGERPLGWPRWCTAFLRPYTRQVVAGFQPFLAREFLRADRTIAEKHGVPTLVRALCRLAILQPLVVRRVFHPWDACLDSGLPLPEDLHRRLGAALAETPEGAEGILELALDGLLKEAPPLLRLRLECLEAEPRVPLPPSAHAYGRLLEDTEVAREVEGQWRARLQSSAAAAALGRLVEATRYQDLTGPMEGTFPDHPGALDYLKLAYDHAPWSRFDALLGMYRSANPDCVEACFLAVRRCLDRGRDSAAVFQARELIHRDPALAPACHELLAHHLGARGDVLNAHKEWDRARRAAALVEKVQGERRGVSLLDALESHHCNPAVLQEIQRMCLGEDRVAEAHLVRKKLNFHPDRPVLLLVVRWRGAWWDPLGRKRLAFQRQLQEACPFPSGATGFIQVADRASLWRFQGKLRRLNGLIFRR
ncbi:hypothetical protein [Mesoterricola silvestris]|uniref:Uncharacterized protein n=1 Tax=Mesoterricola silvestris TaxID=2927979 RepID=A0AA48GS83_9BACT|nr:hypothetical protein [Mesoterricola silvestris]BDU73305.1 hypothetical protein METEAL_24790 [Mesoterricola silvestris]